MNTTATTSGFITGVRSVAVGVADQDAALLFYRDILGFEVRVDIQITPTLRWVEIAATPTSVSIALIARERVDVVVDTGIRCTSTDVEHAHGELLRRHVVVGGVLRWPGVPAMVTFDDPDGNRFYIVEES